MGTVRGTAALKLCVGRWVLSLISVEINENFTNKRHQMKGKKNTRNNCFTIKQCYPSLSQVKKGKHACGKKDATSKRERKGEILLN